MAASTVKGCIGSHCYHSTSFSNANVMWAVSALARSGISVGRWRVVVTKAYSSPLAPLRTAQKLKPRGMGRRQSISLMDTVYVSYSKNGILEWKFANAQLKKSQ